ncbi:MAG: hypothetical protein ACXVE7_14425 [Solirubrobacteraceae bacterium]
MSFFDEVDEPPRTEPRTTPRTTSRAGSRGRRPSGTGGRRPPGDQQAVQVRRAIALGALVVIILLIALGVHSCQVSATNSALQDYANSVSSLNSQSAANGKSLFTTLAQAAGSGSATNVQNEINQTLTDEKQVLNKAKQMSVPDQVKTAHSKFLLALQMRVDGVGNIAREIQPALAGSATASSIDNLAKETARLYGSDVVYKDYAVPEIYGALHAAGTRFSPINPDQFVTNVEWLIPSFLAQELHVTVPGTSPKKATPGLHGHSLTSVSVGGTTLNTGSTNTVPSSPIPTFTLTFANGGTNNETDVKCKVSINGSSVSGTATVPETFAGKNASCQVKLHAAPPKGTQSVVATVEPVLGEKNTQNNTNTYTVTFQ